MPAWGALAGHVENKYDLGSLKRGTVKADVSCIGGNETTGEFLIDPQPPFFILFYYSFYCLYL